MRYQLIDSGNQAKLEQFGPYRIMRPCAQALWQPLHPAEKWRGVDATFTREGGNQWSFSPSFPSKWIVELEGIRFKVAPTDFGHIGVFPEHSLLWRWMVPLLMSRKKAPSILNLFAYSGGATLAAAKAGAQVCHVDASKGMVSWARENASLNQLSDAPIRWIVDDVLKFLRREYKRERRYDGIILDPPSFGRGNNGEIFKIERDLGEILELCKALLSDEPLFLIFSSHTPGMTPLVMQHILKEVMKEGVEAGELAIEGERPLPSGSFARWWI